MTSSDVMSNQGPDTQLPNQGSANRRPTNGAAHRVLAVFRLHLVSWPRALGWPWAILTLAFVINLAIFGLIQDSLTGFQVTGGLASLYTFAFVFDILVITRFFPLVAGMSVTRRDFYTGTCLFAVAQSVAYAIPLTGLLALERASSGWGLRLRFFGVPYLVQPGILAQITAYTGPFLLIAAVGLTWGVIAHRWGGNGVLALNAALFAALGLLGWLITWIGAWGSVGHWLADQPSLALLAGWPALLAIPIGGGGYLLLRHAAP